MIVVALIEDEQFSAQNETTPFAGKADDLSMAVILFHLYDTKTTAIQFELPSWEKSLRVMNYSLGPLLSRIQVTMFPGLYMCLIVHVNVKHS